MNTPTTLKPFVFQTRARQKRKLEEPTAELFRIINDLQEKSRLEKHFKVSKRMNLKYNDPPEK